MVACGVVSINTFLLYTIMDRLLRSAVSVALAASASVALLADKDHMWVVAPGVLYSAINQKLTRTLRAGVFAVVIGSSLYFQFAAPSAFRLFFPLLLVYS